MTVASLAFLGLSACAGSGVKATAPTTSGSTSTVTSAPPSTTTVAPSPTVTVPGPTAGGAVPAGFRPYSFAAVSDSEWWVLGDVACSHNPCTSLVLTTNGGATFVGLPAPPASLTDGISDPNSADGVEDIQFANPSDGFAYGPTLWATHDGGTDWRQVPTGGQVSALATADGDVFAIEGGSLYRSPVASDAWTSLNENDLDGTSLVVSGADVVVETIYPLANRLLVSHDQGEHFVGYPPPSVGLSCQFDEPVSEVIWALCVTGTDAAVTRSTDGGVSFGPFLDSQQPFVTFASLGAASSTTAVVGSLAGGGIGLYRTSDSGQTFQLTGPQLTGNPSWLFIGFTDANDGVAIADQGTNSSGVSIGTTLYRTVDGGSNWYPVPL